MSSLAAARADNFYYPPDFDPDKHGSLNKYHGTHALRERAAKLSEGILVIRFEVPFHIWCSKCGEKIAKGERFNADKKAIGMYHSTKIWQFSMRHHCGSIITIQTDPKNTEYIVVEGAKRKIEGIQSAEDAEVIELPDDDEKERLARDALYRLEHGEASRKRARTAAEDVAALLEDAHDKHHDAYAKNALLRARLRVARKEAEALDKEHKMLKLPEAIKLLPQSEDDAAAATLAFYTHETRGTHASAEQAARRQSILSEPIFASQPQQRTHKSYHTASKVQHAHEPQTVTSREHDDSHDIQPAISHKSHSHSHTPHSRKHHGRGVQKQHSKSRSHSVHAVHIGDDQQTEAHTVLQDPEDDADDTAIVMKKDGGLVPALQPGSAAGEVDGPTKEAASKRRIGLHSAHAVAKATVASWRAGRAKRANGNSDVNTAGPPPTGSAALLAAGKASNGNVKGHSLPAGIQSKAALLAKRATLQGIGLKLARRKDVPRF